MRKIAQKNTRRPEYNTLPRRAGSRGDQRQRLHLLKNTQQSKRKVEREREDGLSRRAQLREQHYDAKRRRQWILAITLVLILIVSITLARCNT